MQRGLGDGAARARALLVVSGPDMLSAAPRPPTCIPNTHTHTHTCVYTHTYTHTLNHRHRVVDAKSHEEYRELEDGALSQGLVFLGLISLVDPPREGVLEAVDRCRQWVDLWGALGPWLLRARPRLVVGG